MSQIVVSDDSTDDATRLMVSTTFPSVDFVEGPRRGLSANRNSALKATRGSHILFLDDDARLGRGFAAQIIQILESLTRGERSRTIISGLERNRGELIYPSEQSFFGYLNRRYSVKTHLRTSVMNATVFPREVFQEIGFDRNLVYGYDEVDITTRATALGYSIVLCHNAINEHLSSVIEREYYRSHIEASRLYVTLKRYCITDRLFGRALLFAFLAPLHLFASLMRQRGAINGLPIFISCLRKALTYMAQYLRSRPDMPPSLN